MQGIGFRDRIQEFKSEGVSVVGICDDPPEVLKAFAREHDFPFPLLSDPDRKICTAYGACSPGDPNPVRRVTYLISGNGSIRLVLDRLNGGEHPVAVLRYLHASRQDRALPVNSLIFALGELSYDFESSVVRRSFQQAMGSGTPNRPEDLVAFLREQPHQAENVLWLLSLNRAPLYVLHPSGPYGSDGYAVLVDILADQISGEIERFCLPGAVRGTAVLPSGLRVPRVEPAEYAMYSWTDSALVEAFLADAPWGSETAAEVQDGLMDLLQRLYVEMGNPGRSSQQRALNYAATNLFQAAEILVSTTRDGLSLSTIGTSPAVVCRPDSDCWDVELSFFDPRQRLRQARRHYRFTIDVSDVMPVTVGTTRVWHSI